MRRLHDRRRGRAGRAARIDRARASRATIRAGRPRGGSRWLICRSMTPSTCAAVGRSAGRSCAAARGRTRAAPADCAARGRASPGTRPCAGRRLAAPPPCVSASARWLADLVLPLAGAQRRPDGAQQRRDAHRAFEQRHVAERSARLRRRRRSPRRLASARAPADRTTAVARRATPAGDLRVRGATRFFGHDHRGRAAPRARRSSRVEVTDRSQRDARRRGAVPA